MKLRHALLATAITLSIGASGQASAQQTAPATPSGATAPTPGASGLRKLDDMKVVAVAGDEFGEIDEVLINASGQVVAVVVEAGGWMGMGKREVVVQLDQLRFENGRFVTSLTKEQFGALPKWD
jgi:hypothetical protein